MKIFKRVLTFVLILIALAGGTGFFILNILQTRAVPDYNKNVKLENLDEKVSVLRDSLGIPHIYAQNDLDLYRTVGYVMAQDRLWQMDLLRRVTTGRLSEVLDPGLVDTDLLFRAMEFQAKSEMVLSKTDPEIVACLEAFADGVNQFIEQNGKKLPFEFAMLGYKPDPWEPVHTANMICYMAWDLALGWSTDIALFKLKQVLDEARYSDLIPDMDLQNSYIFRDFQCAGKALELESHMDEAISLVKELGLEVFQASNNWAVSGKRSKTGMPIMANDMHLGLMAPGIWYQMHHVVEGKMNVTGVVLPGSPFVIAGHNENIGWGMTNVMLDDMDFYMETINPKDSNQYRLDGQWKDMRIVEEEIAVKGLDETIRRVNRYTHRGPVVSKFRGLDEHVLSVRWQGREYSNELRTVYLLNRAANWEDFRNAVKTFTSVSQNIVYADRFGNIGLQTSAGIPIRKGKPELIFPGDTSLYDWTGQVPFEELPYAFNPECGYVSSANNRTVGDDYPHYISTWYVMPDRINRIREMLDSRELHGIDEFKLMLRDQLSHFARDITPVYLKALDGQTEGQYEQVRQLMEEWDYIMDKEEAAPMVFDVLWIELNAALFADELGEELFPTLLANNIIARNLLNRIVDSGSSAWCDNVNTSKVESFEDNILTAFKNTIDTLSSRFGEDPSAWRWGDLHQLTLEHPLGGVDIVHKLFKVNRGPYPIGGSSHTVCPYSYPLGKEFIANHGASERHIFNTADWDLSLTIIPTGTSGVPASPHYLDQTESYVKNKFHRDPFSLEAVDKVIKYRAEFK